MTLWVHNRFSHMDYKLLAQRVLISQTLMLNLELNPKYNEIDYDITIICSIFLMELFFICSQKKSYIGLFSGSSYAFMLTHVDIYPRPMVTNNTHS